MKLYLEKAMMRQVTDQYHKRDLWIKENLNYVEPHFRLEKAAGIINGIARGKKCDLLDVGCGPAALMPLLDPNIDYHGIDIAIHNPAPYLIQTDFLETPIGFGDKKFDVILAQGVFEYMGNFQSQKFAEIRDLLNEGGQFIVSYVNFNHMDRYLYTLYNNIQSFDEFYKSLAHYFQIDRFFPTSHNWHHWEPTRPFLKKLHMHININIPFISPLFAIEYFFICSAKDSDGAGSSMRPRRLPA
jgi:SAM-dependent methyltransferase